VQGRRVASLSLLALVAALLTPQAAFSQQGWSATASLGIARLYQTATLLPSGKVLVVGGIDNTGASVASAESYCVVLSPKGFDKNEEGGERRPTQTTNFHSIQNTCFVTGLIRFIALHRVPIGVDWRWFWLKN